MSYFSDRTVYTGYELVNEPSPYKPQLKWLLRLHLGIHRANERYTSKAKAEQRLKELELL